MKSFAIIFSILFLNAPTIQQQYNGCIFKTSNTEGQSIKRKYNLFSLPPTDPLYTPTVQEIIRIQSCFGVAPIFFFYDDRERNNAMASDEVTQPNGPDGTVIFGRRLFNREYIKSFGGTTIPIIMAHEYAHIVDFKYGALQNEGSKRIELFADFLAGCYMYHRVANGIYTDVSECLKSFESLGDTNFGSSTEHGSPSERHAALLAGYNRTSELHKTNLFIPLTLIIEEGKKYIKDIKVNEPGVKDPR